MSTKKKLFISILCLIAMFLLFVMYLNRLSEDIIDIFVNIIIIEFLALVALYFTETKKSNKVMVMGIIAILTAAISIAVVLFSSIEDDRLSVNILIPRDTSSVHPGEFFDRLTLIGSKHNAGYHLFHIINMGYKNKEVDSSRFECLGIDFVETAFCYWLSSRYNNHWQIVKEKFQGINGGQYTIEIQKDADTNVEKITKDELNKLFGYNYFTISSSLYWGISIPNETQFNITNTSKHERIFTFHNTEMTFSIKIKNVGGSGFKSNPLGEKIIKSNSKFNKLYSDNFIVTFHCKYNKLLRGSPNTYKYKKWVQEIMLEFQNDFEWDLIIVDLERSYEN